jgi:hypothetical protein
MTPHKLILGVLLVLAIIGLGVLTGRRKFLVEILVFGSAYMALLLYFGRGGLRLAILSSMMGLIGFFGVILLLPDEKKEVRPYDAPYQSYLDRSSGVLGDVPQRFRDLGLGPISWAYNRYGLLGAGLGSGAQGAQHFGAVGQGAAEGGLGKIWLELGAPGFLIVAWFGFALARHLWTILCTVSRQSIQLSRMALGLMSFLVANVANYTVATQAYGDVMVLLLVGSTLGALLAMPILAERGLQKRILRLATAPNRVLLPHPA